MKGERFMKKTITQDSGVDVCEVAKCLVKDLGKSSSKIVAYLVDRYSFPAEDKEKPDPIHKNINIIMREPALRITLLDNISTLCLA